MVYSVNAKKVAYPNNISIVCNILGIVSQKVLMARSDYVKLGRRYKRQD
jgi:hypothetical protein